MFVSCYKTSLSKLKTITQTFSLIKQSSRVLLLVCCIGIQGILFGQINTNIPKVPMTFSFSPLDYNGGIQNWGISQSQDGFMYIANNFGLLEYDGENWNMYPIPNSTKTTIVHAAQDGKIYSGGQNEFGYFEKNNLGKLQYRSLVPLLPDTLSVTNVWGVHEFLESVIYSGDKGIFVYRNDNVEFHKFPSGNGGTYQAKDRLFAFTYSAGMWEWNGFKFLPLKNGEFFINKTAVEVLPVPGNKHLIFMLDGKIMLYDENGNLSEWKNNAEDILKVGLINSAKLLSNNQIAIGTQNKGLVILNNDGSLQYHISKSNGLNGVSVIEIYEDQYNNLWLGMNNGISCVEYLSPFKFVNEAIGLSGTGYDAISANENIYLGTNTGLFKVSQFPNTTGYELNMVEGSAGQIYSIAEINEEIYVGSHRGPMKIVDEKTKLLNNKLGAWKFIEIPLKNDILLGTYEGFHKLNPDGENLIEYPDIKESSRVFEFANDSTLWMTHSYRGAYKLEFDSELNKIKNISLYDSTKGFPSNLLINVFSIDGRLVFPGATGIFKYSEENDRFEHYEELEEIIDTDSHLTYLSQDIHGNIYYMIGANTFGVLKRNSFQGYQKFEAPFRRIGKYLSDDLENISILDAENILIGAKDGFIHYDPSIPFKAPVKFSTFIRQIELHGVKDSTLFQTTYSKNEYPNIDYENNSVSFNFASPYYDGLNSIQYQYQLVGFDKQWSGWHSGNIKEYTNLPQGIYTFRVKGRNTYGEEGSIAEFKFSISPPWYKSNLAYTAYSLIVFASFIFSLVIQNRRHKEEKSKIEKEKTEQIQAKEVELKNISASKEQEVMTLQNEKISAELEHKNKELMSSTMHLMNKNEILVSIKQDIEKLAKNSQEIKSRKLEHIIKTIDNNLAEDENWNQFTSHFDQVHEGFLHRLKENHGGLTPQETRLASFLRMNLNSKDIAQLTNISVRSVEVSRYRLRKKLGLEREVNLASYLMEL